MAKDRTPAEFKIPERPLNEIFCSMNGSPEDYAFRNIKGSYREDWDEIKNQISDSNSK